MTPADGESMGARRPTVAMIGAGFSGLLTALHLLASPDGPKVRLLERRGVFGRGPAYSTDNPEHLLNVRLGNMSAFPQEPDHFVRWLASHSGWRTRGPFVTRGVYGDYLQSLLREAVTEQAGRLLLEADGVQRVRRRSGRWDLVTDMGRTLHADAVVLAVGSPGKASLPGLDPALAEHPRYISNPWSEEPLADFGAHVLLIGTGLTMVDVVIAHAVNGRRFTAISRRGLLPNVHGPSAPSPGRIDLVGGPREALRALRALSAERPWREVIDEARHGVQDLWASWSQSQRNAFLRHLRPWWDIHRHRMAPQVARQIEILRETGELDVQAGSLAGLGARDDDLEVTWRPRGGRRVRTARFSAVINCTGQHGDLRRTGQPLIHGLLADGLIRSDPCRLGADVDDASRLIGADGAPTTGLYAVGPLTRGAFWEITSVPDIRWQAADVAHAVLHHLSRRNAF